MYILTWFFYRIITALCPFVSNFYFSSYRKEEKYIYPELMRLVENGEVFTIIVKDMSPATTGAA
ncbi:MAG: hypothetical protein AAGU27_03665 [Dehalobacterium sp.]